MSHKSVLWVLSHGLCTFLVELTAVGQGTGLQPRAAGSPPGPPSPSRPCPLTGVATSRGPLPPASLCVWPVGSPRREQDGTRETGVYSLAHCLPARPHSQGCSFSASALSLSHSPPSGVWPHSFLGSSGLGDPGSPAASPRGFSVHG